MLRCHRRRSNDISAHLEEHAPQMILLNDQMPQSLHKWCSCASPNPHKWRTKRSTTKSPADRGIWFCLKNVYQTQNQLKSNKIIYISRRVFNSKRRTKRSTTKSPADRGICFCLKNAYQTQNQLKSNKIIYISRHVLNSKRRTKRSTTKSPADRGIWFCL
jgi:hypothetical protein